MDKRRIALYSPRQTDDGELTVRTRAGRRCPTQVDRTIYGQLAFPRWSWRPVTRTQLTGINPKGFRAQITTHRLTAVGSVIAPTLKRQAAPSDTVTWPFRLDATAVQAP